MSENAELDYLYDAADEWVRANQEQEHETWWALAEAARAGTPPEAMRVLEKATGVHL